MTDKKISQLNNATTPLAGTEVLPIVQSGSTVKVSVANLTAGRTVDAATVNATTVDATNVEVTNVKAKDGTTALTIADSTGVVTAAANPILNAGTANGVLYLNASKVSTSGSAITYDETTFGVNSAAVFNDAGADVDFRIEGDTNANLFFVDASTDRIGVGTNAPTEKLTVAAAGKIEVLRSDDARGGQLFSDSSGTHLVALAAGDDPLFLETLGSGGIRFFTSASEKMRLTGAGNLGIGTTSPEAKLSVDGSAIFNDSGADVDFRVESDTNTHALFVDAGLGRVGINTSTLSSDLEVNASLGMNAGRLKTYVGTTGTITATTGTQVFTFSTDGASSQAQAFVKLSVSQRGGSNTASNSPAAEYWFVLFQTNAGVCSIHNDIAQFEFTYVKATHFAFANLGSGQCTVTLTNPTGINLLQPPYKVEILTRGASWSLSSVTAT